MGQKLHHSTPYLTLTTRSRTWFQVSVTLIPRHSTLFTSDDLYVGCAKPFFANASKLGVSHGPPKQPICPKPTSSRTMNSTLGAPSFARNRSGQARLRYIEGAPTDAAERSSGFVFFKSHKNSAFQKLVVCNM